MYNEIGDINGNGSIMRMSPIHAAFYYNCDKAMQ